MNFRWLPCVVFCLCVLGFIGCLFGTASQLPERLASHFGANGQADGWMSRSGYLTFIAAIGLALPLLIAGVFYAMRFFPDRAFNLPHREYWLAPERRLETCNFFFRCGFWYASMMVAFLTSLHVLTIQANRQGPEAAALSLPLLACVAGCFLVGTLVWVILLILHFYRQPDKSC
jgi:uncharacterized membrane protein